MLTVEGVQFVWDGETPFFVCIELAGPPQGKGRGRAVAVPGRGARVYSDPKTVKYETQLRHAATVAMGDRAPYAGAVSVEMRVNFPVPASWSKKKRAAALAGIVLPTVKPDCDNLLKVIDAINQVVFVDDKQVADATVRKRYSDRPGMIIDVRAMGEGA